MYTEEVNEIALTSNDKRLQTFDEIQTYPYGKNDFKVCESEAKVKLKVVSKECESEMNVKEKM